MIACLLTWLTDWFIYLFIYFDIQYTCMWYGTNYCIQYNKKQYVWIISGHATQHYISRISHEKVNLKVNHYFHCGHGHWHIVLKDIGAYIKIVIKKIINLKN